VVGWTPPSQQTRGHRASPLCCGRGCQGLRSPRDLLSCPSARLARFPTSSAQQVRARDAQRRRVPPSVGTTAGPDGTPWCNGREPCHVRVGRAVGMAEQLEPQLRVLLDNIGHTRAVAYAISRRHRPPAKELLKARKRHLAALEQYAAEVE